MGCTSSKPAHLRSQEEVKTGVAPVSAYLPAKGAAPPLQSHGVNEDDVKLEQLYPISNGGNVENHVRIRHYAQQEQGLQRPLQLPASPKYIAFQDPSRLEPQTAHLQPPCQLQSPVEEHPQNSKLPLRSHPGGTEASQLLAYNLADTARDTTPERNRLPGNAPASGTITLPHDSDSSRASNTPESRPSVLRAATPAPGSSESFRSALARAEAAEAAGAMLDSPTAFGPSVSYGRRLQSRSSQPRSLIGSSMQPSPVNKHQGTRTKWVSDGSTRGSGESEDRRRSLPTRLSRSPRQTSTGNRSSRDAEGPFSQRLTRARARMGTRGAVLALPSSKGDPPSWGLSIPLSPTATRLTHSILAAMGWQPGSSLQDDRFDALCTVMAALFHMPMAAVFVVGPSEGLICGAHGVSMGAPLERSTMLAAWTFATLRPEVTIIPDCKTDMRTKDNTVVAEARGVRFLASVPLLSGSGDRMGVICLMDTRPRALDAESAKALATFAVVASRDVERVVSDPPWSRSQQSTVPAGGEGLARVGGTALVDTSLPGWPLAMASAAFSAVTGVSEAVAEDGVPFWDLFSHCSGLHGEHAAACCASAIKRGGAFTVEATRVTTSASDKPTSAGRQTTMFSCRFSPVGADALDAEAPPVSIPGCGILPSDCGLASIATSLFFVTAHQVESGQGRGSGLPTVKAMRRLESITPARSPPFDDVELGAFIGRSASGCIFKGTSKGNPVAVKVVEHDVAHDLMSAAREEMDAALGSLLQHVNVMRTLAYTTRHLPSRGSLVGRPIINTSPSPLSSSAGSKASRPPAASPAESGGDSPTDSINSRGLRGPRDIVKQSSGPSLSPAAGELGRLASMAGSNDSSGGKSFNEPGGRLHVRMQTWIVEEHLCSLGSLQLAMDKGSFRNGSLREGGPNMGRILTVALQLASALSYMHVRGIHHGSLNPNNVLLTMPDASSKVALRGTFLVAKVADYGLSTVSSGSGSVTVTHVAPEALQGGRLGRQADIFAFGVLLWELYVCERPWAGRTEAEVVALRMSLLGDCDPGLPFPLGTPPAFKGLALRCLATNPHVRPAADELEGQVGGMIAALAAATLPEAIHFPLYSSSPFPAR